MGIEYKKTKIFKSEELVKLFTSVGWVEESAKYPNRLGNAMCNSSAVFSAWDNDKLVGLLSAIDDTMHAYGIYLLVDPAYQDQGIGKELFLMFEERYEGYKKEFKTVKTQKYYEQFGYVVDSVGMVKNDLPGYDI
ncbi:MAG: GNAT family N-acetyltransferase [Lachnospiraceae bacterium]|nr:GNAT family N-acetyltransferase [Lachnospiraceae bacterium]